MKKAIFKYNSGHIAMLCSSCSAIIKCGYEFSEEELKACRGEVYLPPQICNKCKQI